MYNIVTYLLIVLIVAFIVISVGYVGPLLISYPDTFAVTLGFIYMFVVAPVGVYAIIRVIANRFS